MNEGVIENLMDEHWHALGRKDAKGINPPLTKDCLNSLAKIDTASDALII
jgi:hypothetical protein